MTLIPSCFNANLAKAPATTREKMCIRDSPNSLGQYDQTPEEMASEVKEYIDEGLVNIIGGCCGTTEEYIHQFLSKNARNVLPDKQNKY